MRSHLFVPSLANPHARFLALGPIVAQVDSPNICQDERRVLRQVARGLYASLTPSMQRAFRSRYFAQRAAIRQIDSGRRRTV